ncbi:MAG: ABC transporter permease subunit [Pseudonocardiaceae bacterium]|nr:ABC transporter permease subunit [Pseudonocardiaceae bacterium]
MNASVVAEFMKLVKRPATWLIAVVWMLLTLVFGYVFPYFSYRGTSTGPGEPVGEQALSGALPAELASTAIQGMPLFAGALALLLGVLATGSEYGWDTVKVLLTQGPRRLSVLGGKLVALAVLMLAIVLATFVVDGAASVVVASITDSPVNWPPFGELARGVGAGWLIVVMWCFGGAFLGTMLRGTALAVDVGLVWALAIENLVRAFGSVVDFVDVVQRYLPGTNAGSLVAALGGSAQGQPGGTPGVTEVVSGTHAAVVLGAYLIAFAVLACVLLRRRDVL